MLCIFIIHCLIPDFYLRITGNFKGTDKGKVHSRTGHEGPEGV